MPEMRDFEQAAPGLGKAEWGLAGVVAASVFLGLAALASDSIPWSAAGRHHFLERQLIWSVLGFLAAGLAARFDYRMWRQWASVLSAICIATLLLVVVAPGFEGAHRSVRDGTLGIQISEIAKFIMIVMTASHSVHLARAGTHFTSGLVVLLVLLRVVVALIFVGRDAVTAVLLACTCWVILFISGIAKRWLFTPIVLGLICLGVYFCLHPLHWARLLAAFHPTDQHNLMNYIRYCLVERQAILLRGGVENVVLMQAIYSDFMFGFVREQFGWPGALSILALCAGFLVCGTSIAKRAPDPFGRLLGVGITTLITLQAGMHIGAIVGFLPWAGRPPLPFLGYGGTSLIMSLLQVGVLLNIGRQAASRRTEELVQGPSG